MKKKLTLINRFTQSFVLINRQIIKYAVLCIKKEVIESESIDDINNSVLYKKNEDLVIGAYEANYLCAFCKLIRKQFLHEFFQSDGHFKIALFDGCYHGLIERLLEKALNDCGFEFKKTHENNSLIYITD
jgi:hypothetical protein